MQATSAPPLPTPRPPSARARSARAETLVWALAAALLLAVVAISVERKVTWYLAVDQYGYLTFANDLAHGKVFHDWPLLGAIGSRLPERIDVLSQTYVYDRGRVYCRYAPGFPLLLAGWMRVFGENAVHALNPLVFLALLCLALAYQARAVGDRWRALAGTTLIVLCPTFLHLWALTLVRDLSAHLAGVAGLLLVLPVPGRPRALTPLRTAAAGLAIGYAASIRPDAVIYVVPAVLVAGWQWLRAGLPASRVIAALGAGALSVLIGLAPFLGFNYLATGNPIRPTQGMELDSLLPAPAPEPAVAPAPVTDAGRVGYPSLGWQGGTNYGVQGGGFRLSNFRHTLPGNIQLLRGVYGDTLLGLAVLGALLAMVLHPALFLTAVPYCVLALLVFSCWSRPDGRYLSGVFVFIPMLVVEGAFGLADLLSRMARRARPAVATSAGIAVAVALGASALVPPIAPAGALPILTVVVPLAAAVAALAATLAPGRRLAAWAAPALALGLVVLTAARARGGEQRRATFQRPQMERARATLAEAVRPGALVVTTEDVGRPAENIDYYSGGARAVYLTDLARWRIGVAELAHRASRIGITPYLLLPADHPDRDQLFASLLAYRVTLVADIPAERAIDYFVAAAFHRGVRMQLHRIDVPPGIFEPGLRAPRR